jgi:hypothetical protein
VLALSLVAAFATAQNPDGSDLRAPAKDPRILLEYASFDPNVSVPMVPAELKAGTDVNLHIVQFKSTPTDADREAIRRAGGVIKGYLPHDAHIVHMQGGGMELYSVDSVRWVGPYEPAYRLEPQLLKEIASGQVPTRRYNMVMVDKRNDKDALAAKIAAMGGDIVDRHEGGLLFTAALTGAQLMQAARLDEVLWIDRWTPVELDMDNARIQGGANYIESVAGYTGSGIRGHVYEGVEANHPDFNTVMTQVGPAACSGPTSHGHCTAGIIFGNGTSAPQARGLAPNAVGFFTTYVSSTNTTCAQSPARNTILGNAVNNNNVMFTTASWGNTRTFFYTSISADADDIVFDHRIPWTQSQSNAGNQDSRPQAWGKNIISVGGVDHFNDSNPNNDSWLAGNGSTGPAQDGRNKPDLCAYYDSIWTSDRTGNSGYSSGNSTTSFGGTSGATPIVAGHNALAIQMFTDHIFDNIPVNPTGSRFQNRPLAQTVKALQIACADLYTPTASDNRREHVGWGFPNVQTMYDNRDKISIIPEDEPIAQGQTRTYRYDVAPGESVIKFVMSYVDPAGNPAAAFDRINDLSMRVTSPTGAVYYGNWGLDGGSQGNQSTQSIFAGYDTRDTVECVIRNNPTPGIWTVTIVAPTVTQDAHLATAQTDATFALVVNGGRRAFGSGCARYLPNASTTFGSGNYFPWGGYNPVELDTVYASNNGGGVGGTVYFDVTVTEPVWIHSVMVNTSAIAGEDLFADVYTTNIGGTYFGNEATPAAWNARSAGRGTSAGVDAESQIDLAQPFRLSAGTYGFAINANNFAHRYTNGANTYNNSVMTIDAGSGSNGLFGGGVFNPRSANITMKYRTADATAQNMRYQTILRSDELGGPGDITGLAFSGQSNGRHFNSNLTVRMAHKPAGYTLVSNFNTNISGSTTVLSSNLHTFEYRDGQWRNIGMQNPFAYNGTSDVVVEIVARGNVQTTTGSGIGPFEIDSDRPRVFAQNWDLSTPTTGTVATTSGLRMRVEFGCANANQHGSSCGTLESAHSGSSALGSTFNFNVSGATPNFVAFLGLGENNSFPYPLALTNFGWTNCNAFSQSITTIGVNTNGSGSASYSIGVPNNTALTGYKVFGQWVGIDTSEPGDLTFSGLTRMICGGNL